LSHDGITTFNELVDAQQNLYNVGYDLAVTLATTSIALDGDILTGKLSLGCEATSRTAALGGLLSGTQPGLNGHAVSLL
jgi:unspecific peroxygenase